MKRWLLLGSLALVIASSSGCLWAPELDRIRKDIEREIPGAHFDRSIALSLGPITLFAVRLVASLAPGTREARSYLKDIRGLKLAVYEVEGKLERDELAALAIPERLRHLLEKKGWEIAVRAREGDETIWVLYKSDAKSLRDLYIVTLDDEELVLVRAYGRLDRLLRRTIREHT